MLKIYRNNLPAIRLHDFTAYDLINRPVTALNQDVRHQFFNNALRGFLVKSCNKIDASKRTNDLAALLFRKNGAVIPLDRPYRTVTVQSHDQHIALISCSLQVAYVTRMQKIKAPVGKDGFLAFAF